MGFDVSLLTTIWLVPALELSIDNIGPVTKFVPIVSLQPTVPAVPMPMLPLFMISICRTHVIAESAVEVPAAEIMKSPVLVKEIWPG